MDTEELAQLEQIFPAWDRESLFSVLQANGMNIDRAVEAIFIIESAKENGEDIVINEEPAPSSTNRNKPKRQPQGDIIQEEFYRGLRIKLPDDFLRVG
jgi:hypothetical protein